MPEGENPTRRYKWLRPRQANWAAVTTVTPTNFATIYLFNNSAAAQLIVGRRAVGFDASFNNFNFSLMAGKTGTLQSGGITPMVAGESVQPGQIFYDDRAAVYTPNISQGLSGVQLQGEPYPYYVLQPGFSFVAQSPQAGQSFALSLLWETIFPDELDYLFDL